MSPITTHVLDLTVGHPAAGIPVTLEFREEQAQSWIKIGLGSTDSDGRIHDLLPKDYLIKKGLYCLRFDTSVTSSFFPEVSVQFRVTDTHQHYHIPLLLTSFGYSTYRGG
jgi:5-hydroxyisourate hydrolase